MALTKISRGLLNTGVSDSSDATAITINASENVGIGTTSPSKKLHVKGDEIVLEDPGGGFKLELNADANPVTITANDNTGANYCGFKLQTNNGGTYPVTAMDVYPHGGASVAFGAGARTDTKMLISRAPTSATQTTPETLLVLSTPCTSTSSNIPVGQGPRIVFEIPDDQTGNKATGAAIAALKEVDSDVNSQTSLAFYTSDDDETLDQNMTILSDGKVGIGTTSPASKFHISATGEARLILEGDSDNDTGEESSLLELRTDGGAVRHRVEATGSGGNDLKITAGADQTTNTLNSEIIFETKTANSSTAERMRINADGYVVMSRDASEYGLELRSAGTRSGMVLATPNSGNTIKGSVLLLADDTFRLGTQSVYNIHMYQNGAVTKPNNPSFSARHSTTVSNFGINSYVQIPFDTEIYDTLGNLASSGTFTAPTTGRYLLCATVRFGSVDASATYSRIVIATSNRTYQGSLLDHSVLFSGDADYHVYFAHFIADMDANDTANVSFYQYGGSAQADMAGDESFFSGELIG